MRPDPDALSSTEDIDDSWNIEETMYDEVVRLKEVPGMIGILVLIT